MKWKKRKEKKKKEKKRKEKEKGTTADRANRKITFVPRRNTPIQI
jgi:hypothetical protein